MYASAAARMPLKAVNGVLARLEGRARDPDAPLPHVPVLIVGAPRTGSTLLYQVLTQCFDFGYLGNVHCLFWGAPSWAQRLVGPLRPPAGAGYDSRHGVTRGWFGPSECGEYWYRFFRRNPQWVSSQDVSAGAMRRLRQSLHSLCAAFARPMLFKNMPCALRMEPLLRAVPEAVFILTRRDLVDTARSLLAVRYERTGAYDNWWSMRPKGYEALAGRPAHEQVVEQVRLIEREVERARAGTDEDRFLMVDYESLGSQPASVTDALARFFERHAVGVERRSQPPPRFDPRRREAIDPALDRELRRYVESR
jgi:hypothetical protein